MKKISETRDNHYVPQWYQRGFLSGKLKKLHYLDLIPDAISLPNGQVKSLNYKWERPTSQCFYQTDLYTTFFGDYINDEVERFLFGEIDDTGAKAVWAYIDTDMRGWHDHFHNFFSYIDSQKIRTPKGLDWIKKHYPNLGQVDLMVEMQALRNMHCTLWVEGVREIVSSENSSVKFIVSDHPVTIYNYACDPSNEQCVYPNDPSIALKGTQTLFPLDENHCLIITNLEYAQDPEKQDPTEKRTNARFVRQSMARTDAFIRTRNLNENEVSTINFIIKSRARKYIAASQEEWLYPEKSINTDWKNLKSILLPPEDELYHFGGEMYVGYKDGSTYYQDAFGRTIPENKYLRKEDSKKDIGKNDPCGCGSGKKYKKCCKDKPENERPTWEVLSIRERNLILYNGVEDILGLNNGKTWDDVRRELSDDQIVKIHELYGFLWPKETDIFSLLPKPDNTLRAVYTGMLDPRTITLFALGSVPYFDEILIQHPFVNPCTVKPEFSPVDSPSQYKYQTLKNILLFLYLEPFIRSGVINFIPDPCCFDYYLHRQMMNMAEQRRGGQEINEKEAERFIKLGEDDFHRTIRALPMQQKIHQIRKAMPDISQKQLEELLEYMKEQNDKDPLALLQDDVISNGGQLMMSSMAPNFEMVLFIAQATGSVILTDSETRWEELKSAQFKEDGFVSYPWSEIVNALNAQEFIYYATPETSYAKRSNGSFGDIRKTLRDIFLISKQNRFNLDMNLIDTLKADVISGIVKASNGSDEDEPYKYFAKLHFLMPKGGFVNNNVQRLLLKSGSEHHLAYAPLVIFVESDKVGAP